MSSGDALYQFTHAFVEELARSGLHHVSLCPGSRSTPLALPLRQHPGIRVWTHLDERSAAFFALGMAMASGEPVGVLSTSGTAAVNFAPAVVEAYYSRVPLLVLTADRPPELRQVGAPQTIDQYRLYGSHAKWFAEAILPEASAAALRYARTLACRAVATARADRPGPVHLNLPFREPLVPSGEGPAPGARAGQAATEGPFVAVTQAPRRPQPDELRPLAQRLRAAARGLIVCGPQADPGFAAAVMLLAEELEYPVLADPLSQVRCGPHHHPRVLDSYDALLRAEAVAQSLEPEVVLRFGGTPTSRPLLQYLQRHAESCQLLIDDGDGWNDPLWIASEVVHAQPRAFCEALTATLRSLAGTPRDDARAWARGWQELSSRARHALNEGVDAAPALSEPRVVAELAQILPAGATLFAGNSMPIRDVDAFFPGSARPTRFLANRGAGGIDGVVSTALGASAVSAGPLVLLIGDLSFYHDMNGLLAARKHGLRATIVLLNNDGGGIFSFLPQADLPEHFEELFGTPHGLDFRPVAELYGLSYRHVEDPAAFRQAVQEAVPAEGVTIIEVRTERGANAELHRELWRAASSAVAPAVAGGVER